MSEYFIFMMPLMFLWLVILLNASDEPDTTIIICTPPTTVSECEQMAEDLENDKEYIEEFKGKSVNEARGRK